MKEYTFYNVTSHEDAMYNFANAIADAGWIIDKIQIVDSNNCDLYVHSNGINGNQNLYYSFRFYRQSSTYFEILVYCNTGFDSNRPVNNQPGKWFELSNTASSCVYPCALRVFLPILVQKIFANSWFALLYTHFIFNSVNTYIPQLMIGSIQSYKLDYPQNNFVHWTNFHRPYNMYRYSSTTHVNGKIRLLFENQTKEESLSIGYYRESDPRSGAVYSTPLFSYNSALTAHPMTNKTIFIKPVISVSHSIGGYNYFFPIGELPFYYTLFYPYYYAYDLTTFGNRTFRILPILRADYNYGMAIEIQT